MLVCPFAFQGVIIEPSNVPRFLFVNFLFLAIFASWFYAKRSLSIPTLFLSLILFFYYCINVISVFWCLNTADALYESQKVVIVLFTLLLIYNWQKDITEEINLVKSFILITLVSLLFAFYQIMQLPNLNFETLYDVFSFSEHKNLLASLLFLLLCFPLYGILFFSQFWKGISLVIFSLAFLLLFFLQVRSVYLAMLVTGLILGFYFLKRPAENKKVLLYFVCGGALILMLIVWINPAIIQRLDLRTYTSSTSGAERIKIWAKTISLIKEHPLAGVGAGNWQYNFSKFGIGDIENISKNDISFQRPHNDFLWIISETGSVGFLLILLILLYVFVKSFPAIKSGNTRVMLLFSFLCGLLVEAFFSFPKERITHIVLASTMLALLFKNLNIPLKVSIKKSRGILKVSLVILCVSMIIGSYRLKGEYYTLLMLNEKNRDNPREVIGFGNKANSFFYKTDPTSTPISTYLGWAFNALNKRDSVLFESERAYLLSPYDYEVLSNYGLALEKARDKIKAKKMLSEALRINPIYEPALMNLFILKYNSKNYHEALTYLSAIPDYQNKFPAYYSKVMEKINNPKLP